MTRLEVTMYLPQIKCSLSAARDVCNVRLCVWEHEERRGEEQSRCTMLGGPLTSRSCFNDTSLAGPEGALIHQWTLGGGGPASLWSLVPLFTVAAGAVWYH